MFKHLSIITAAFIATILVTTVVNAAEPTPPGCQPLYNGGTVCQNSNLLEINKKILSPNVDVKPGTSFNDKDFIENLGRDDTAYTANKTTAFRIYLKNKTRASLKKITVKDIFPPRYLTFVAGNGSYDSTSRTFTATIDEIKANETKQITVQVMTAPTSELSQGTTPLCTINIAMATVNNKISQDTSQICISRTQASALTQAPQARSVQTPTPTIPSTTKGGLPVLSPAAPQPGQRTPETGPEMLALIGLLPAGAVGWLLRKRA